MLEEGRPDRLIRGRYRLIAEIDSGGMGRVWEARDEQLGRPVAVKEVRLHVASPREREDRLARAEREGRNAVRAGRPPERRDPWTGTITNPHNTDFSVPDC